MAHHFSVKTVPHKNKDGSPSKTKKDYEVWDRSRGKKTLVGVATSKKGAEELKDSERFSIMMRHINRHPHDHAFLNKHGKRIK